MRTLTPQDIQAVSGGAASGSGTSFFEGFKIGLLTILLLLSGKKWGDLY